MYCRHFFKTAWTLLDGRDQVTWYVGFNMMGYRFESVQSSSFINVDALIIPIFSVQWARLPGSVLGTAPDKRSSVSSRGPWPPSASSISLSLSTGANTETTDGDKGPLDGSDVEVDENTAVATKPGPHDPTLSATSLVQLTLPNWQTSFGGNLFVDGKN